MRKSEKYSKIITEDSFIKKVNFFNEELKPKALQIMLSLNKKANELEKLINRISKPNLDDMGDIIPGYFVNCSVDIDKLHLLITTSYSSSINILPKEEVSRKEPTPIENERSIQKEFSSSSISSSRRMDLDPYLRAILEVLYESSPQKSDKVKDFLGRTKFNDARNQEMVEGRTFRYRVYLSSSAITLKRNGLIYTTKDHFWGITPEGKKIFELLEKNPKLLIRQLVNRERKASAIEV